MIKYVCLLCICYLKLLCAHIVACAVGGASEVLVWTDAMYVIRGGGGWEGGLICYVYKVHILFPPKS